MKKPLINPAHRGLLHDDLGIPRGEKIPRARLEEAKRSSDPAVRKRANFALNFNHNGHHGEVVSIGAHHSDPKFARIEIAHGKKKKPKKGQISYYDDRPTSSVVVPADQAESYPVGQRVGVGAMPLDDDDDMGNENDDDADDATDAYHAMQHSIMAGGNRSKRSKRKRS